MALSLYALFEDAISVADLPMNWNSRLWSAILEDQWQSRAFKSLHGQAVAPGSYGLAIDQNAAQSIEILIQHARQLTQIEGKKEEALIIYNRIYTCFHRQYS